jgi:hypothetical protein
MTKLILPMMMTALMVAASKVLLVLFSSLHNILKLVDQNSLNQELNKLLQLHGHLAALEII